MDSFACIVKENNSSIKMFEKIGFKAIDEVVWFGTDTGDDYDWDEYWLIYVLRNIYGIDNKYY